MDNTWPDIETGDNYECANCHGHFRATRSQAECIAEAKANMPPEEWHDIVVICDDCYVPMAKYFGWKLD